MNRLIFVTAGALLAYLVVRQQASNAMNSVGQFFTDMVDSVEAVANAAIDAVYDPENAVSATAGGNARVVDWSGTGNVLPLLGYFQANGNSTDTRNAARAAGWTNEQIALAVATMGSMNGNY